jgi:hypothetical protein
MTDRFPASHAEHDPLLVAALAAGDLAASDRKRAELLASTCPDCGLLAADLRAIATAVAALPARARPRDFSLRPEDSARLRRQGWREFVRTFAGPRSGALRPLATGLTTLGLAGLLLAALPTVQLMGSAAGPSSGGAPGTAASSESPKSVDAAGVPEPTAVPAREYSSQSGRPADPVPVSRPGASPLALDRGLGDGAGPQPTPAAQPEIAVPAPGAASPLVVLSGTFLLLGLGLFGLRWSARRLGDG